MPAHVVTAQPAVNVLALLRLTATSGGQLHS